MVNTSVAASSGAVVADESNNHEIDAINREVKSRSKIWLCGPTPF
ncbi:hypothetical protein AB7M63_006171 [Bradyrhizobium japonicum]